MSKEWRTAHPEKARRITAALTQASQMANDPAQKDQVAEILSQEKYLNQKKELFLAHLAGTYQNWEGEEKTDHERISFGKSHQPHGDYLDGHATCALELGRRRTHHG